MFNVSSLLLDDALKPATPLISASLTLLSALCVWQVVKRHSPLGLWLSHRTPHFTTTLLLGAANMKPAPGGK